MISLELTVQLVLLGSIVGILAGLLGIGGGGVFVPVLTSLFLANHLHESMVVHIALGTSMATIVTTSFSSMLAHKKNQNILWSDVKVMAPAIIVGAFSTTFMIVYLNTQVLTLIFTAFMAFVSYKMFKGGKKDSTAREQLPVSVVPAFTIGSISTLVAIGGGSLSVPYLVSKGRDIKKAIGTSAAIGFPLAIAGTLGYLINGWFADQSSEISLPGVVGFIHLPSVIVLSICGFFSAPIGANLAQKLPMNTLRKIFACLLLCLSLKMLFTLL